MTEEKGSFIPEPESKQSKNPDSPNYPLFKYLESIVNAINEGTKATIQLKEALNALLTTIIRKNETESPITKPVPPPIPIPQPQPKPIGDKILQIKTMFPEDLTNMLEFVEETDHIKIKCRQFLGSENFAKIASVVRSAGGEYVSAGKASHFRIKK